MLPAVTVRCCGTFGELLQGRINGRCFLVTLPIDLYSHATFQPAAGRHVQVSTAYTKVQRLLDALSLELGQSISGYLEVDSMIPRGKGLASSSADLVAVGTAVLSAYGVTAREQAPMIARATGKVEPTDGVMYPGIVSFAQHESRLIESFGKVDLEIIGCLLPGDVDTCAYDSSRIEYTADELSLFKKAYALMHRGVSLRDPGLIGQASTISAAINQKHLPKPHFDPIKRVASRTGAAGLVVAHSGTAIGLLAPQGAKHQQLETMVDAMSQLYGVKARRFRTHLSGPAAQFLTRKVVAQ